MAPGVLGPRPLLLGFVVVYVLLVLYLLSSLSTVPLAPAPRCSKLALGTSAGSTPGDTLAQLVPSSAIPFKFHKVMHIEDLGEQETMLLDEMFQDDRRRHIEMREVVEKAWKHLESTRPDLEIDEVLRADRVFDRQYGTVYTLELVRAHTRSSSMVAAMLVLMILLWYSSTRFDTIRYDRTYTTSRCHSSSTRVPCSSIVRRYR